MRWRSVCGGVDSAAFQEFGSGRQLLGRGCSYTIQKAHCLALVSNGLLKTTPFMSVISSFSIYTLYCYVAYLSDLTFIRHIQFTKDSCTSLLQSWNPDAVRD